MPLLHKYSSVFRDGWGTLKGMKEKHCLFQFNRLPFGVLSATAIFQQVMDSISKDLTGVLAYLDNVLVTGTTTEEHLEHLDKVLSKLNEPGLKHNKTKCIFMALSVEYLGHIMDKTGLHPSNKNKRSTNSYMCYRIENLLGIIKGYRMSLSEFIY